LTSLSVALIGAGYWGSNIARALRTLDGVELAVIVDRIEERARRLAKLYGCRYAVAVDDVLGKVELDAAIVAVSPNSLADVAMELARHGLHVLVEKPVALSAAKARDLAQLVDSKGVVGAAGFIVRFDAAVDVVESLISRVDVYELYALRVGRRPPWLRRTPIALDLAIHDVDLAMYLLGCRLEPRAALVTSVAGDEAFYAVYRCGGAVVQTVASGASLVKVRRMLIHGERLAIDVDMVGGRVVVSTRAGSYVTYASGEEPLRRELRAFVNKIRGVDDDPDALKLASLWDAVRALEAIEGARSVVGYGSTTPGAEVRSRRYAR
jgi:predicted dehydrogenase